jgi:hypothetical protein
MPTYTVHMTSVVSTAIRVEADDPQEAIDNAYNSDDMPGGMRPGAFGRARVDESGEWGAVEVSDQDGKTVWRESGKL